LETELKFEVDAAGAKALGEHLSLSDLGQARKLRAVYYDTPETDLRDHGLSLRVRDDGKRRIQTIKKSSPGGNGFHREEWESVLDGGAGFSPDLDAAARTPLGKFLSRRELGFMRPVFEVEVKRVTRTVEVDGAIIEIALDRGCARAEDRRSPIGEVELELKSGPPSALFALARECASVAPLELSFLSKAARGYALLDDAPPVPANATDPALQPDETCADAFQAIAGAALNQISANARALRQARVPEALHQLRVGVRRLRSAMSLFAPMLADAALDGVKVEFKWFAGELDEARDLDVFTEDVLRPAMEREPDLVGLAALAERFAAARELAYDRAEAAIGSQRFRDLMLSTLCWMEAGEWRVGEDPMLAELRTRPVRVLAREEFDKRRRSILKKARRLVEMQPAERHKLRIRAKRLRYACGFFASLYPGRAQKDFSAAARKLQDCLGALTDIAFSRDLALRIAGMNGADAEPAEAFAAGALVGQAAAPMGVRLKVAVKAQQALRDADVFW
jgi:inorganic triphosphatase YgiF